MSGGKQKTQERTAPRTTTTCKECGAEIPESLLAEALCVGCRYDSPAKKPDAGDPSEYELALEEYGSELSEPSEPEARGAGPDLEQILAWLASGHADAQTIGGRVLMLAYIMPLVDGRPMNLRELGARLGCSHTAARKKVSNLRAHFARESRRIAGGGFQRDPM
jgi:hypothetical protein